jgi:hypothetical protein
MGMTEQAWLACKDLDVMLRFLEGKVSERKLRLFVVACCRRVPRLMREDVCRRAVDLAERFADGAVSRTDLEEVRNVVAREAAQGRGWSAHRAVRIIASSCADPHFTSSCVHAVALARRFAVVSKREENRLQISLLKDIVGNPFRAGLVDGSWFAWNDATIPRLAQAAYDERHLPTGRLDNDRLAVLADALEEAGCTNSDILGHCRGPGPHVRGCFVVDALLAKT